MSGGGSGNAEKTSYFTRSATGLVRELSLFDVFIFNLAANPLGLAVVFILGFQIGLFPGDPVLATILVGGISLVIGATYAQLSSVFPRSGGDYVFNSRILHPALGFGFNFSLSFWEWLAASLSLSFITTLGLSPATVMVGYLSGNASLVSLGTALSSPVDVFIIGTVFNMIISSLFIIGTKRTFRFLDVFYIASFLGFVLIILALLSSSPAIFQHNLNAFLSATGSNQTYSGIISAASSNGLTMPAGYPLGLLPAMMGIVSVEAIWFFWSSYVGGEMRRANSLRRQVVGMLGAAVFNLVLTLVAIVLFINIVGKDMLTSFSYLLNFAPNLVPFSPAAASGDQVVLFASLATNNPAVEFLIPALFVGWSVVVVISFAMQPVKSLFAWSLDRVIPSKFSEVNPRFHTPVYPVLVGALVMEAGLVAQVVVPDAVFLIFTASIVAPAFSSMFLAGVAGALLPYRRKAIFERSGLSRLRVFGVPVVAITGFVTAAYILFLVWVFFSYANFFLNTPLLEFLSFGFIPLGILVFYVARAYRKKEGIDLELTFAEIPPD